MTRLVRTKYQQYKLDTQRLSQWLGKAGWEYGFPLANFARSTRPHSNEEEEDGGEARTPSQVRNARKKARRKAKKMEQREQGGASLKAPSSAAAVAAETGNADEHEQANAAGDSSGSYLLKVAQYAEIARFLVSKGAPIPTEFMQLLRNCIKLRVRSLRRFLLNPDDSTRTHEFFIDVLREVQVIFEGHREEQARAAAMARGAGEEELTSSAANRFASLASLESEDYKGDVEEEMPDIQLPPPPRPRGASVSTAQPQFDLEESKETAVMMLLTFYEDMATVREYIKVLWAEYREGTIDLVTAAVTSNTALELLRKPYEDVVARAIKPFFNNDLALVTGELCDLTLKQRGMQPWTRPLPDYKELYDQSRYSDAERDLYEYFLVPNLQVLLVHANLAQKGQFQMNVAHDSGDLDRNSDFRKKPYHLRWPQAMRLINESYTDYILMAHLCRLEERRHVATAEDGLSSHPMFIDELAIEARTFTVSRRPSLLMAFHNSCFVDIVFELGGLVSRGFEELRVTSLRMQETLAEREKVESSEKPPGWLPGHEAEIAGIKRELQRWTAEVDAVNSGRERLLRQNSKRPPIPNVNGLLMKRSPVLCGLMLFRLQLRLQKAGIGLSNVWRSIVFGAHLFVACRHSGRPPNQAALRWFDMEDKILKLHSPQDLFGGETPKTISDSYRSAMCMSGKPVSVRSSATLHTSSLQDDGTPTHQYSAPGSGLKDYTKLLPIFTQRLLGSGKEVQIDLSVIEALLSDMRAREEKKQREEAAAVAHSKARKRNLLRQERSHKATKYSIPQLLAVLEAALRVETELIRFDYIRLHVTCMRIFKALRDTAPTLLFALKAEEWHNAPDIELSSIAVHVVQHASRSGRVIVRNKVTQKVEAEWSKPLARASAVIAAVLESERDTELEELDKLQPHVPTAD